MTLSTVTEVMKSTLITLISITLLVSSSFRLLAQTAQAREKHFNVEKSLALDGYDPVTYFLGSPTKGKPGISAVHNGITYYFVNAQNQAAFKSDVEKYEPAYGGWCAFAMGETGEKVKVDPKTYKIFNGKLYLFYNFWGNNTLEGWNQNENALKAKADSNWQKIVQ
ncbi:MAG: YHS domain-containing (seleno)protein [Cyclobacteriaceae bacterium]